MRTLRSEISSATANWLNRSMMQAGGSSCNGLPAMGSCMLSPSSPCHRTIPVRNALTVAPSCRSRSAFGRTSATAVGLCSTEIRMLLVTFCKKLFLLIKTVPRGTREPTSWSRKTLLDIEPLLLLPSKGKWQARWAKEEPPLFSGGEVQDNRHGNVHVKVLPPLGTLSTFTEPPWSSTILL